MDHLVKTGDEAGVRRLVRLGTPLDALVDRRSPLMRATMANKVPMVRALLDMGATVDFTNEDGWTALHLAANHNSAAVVDMLMEAGAELEARSNTGRTPLAQACRKKQLAVAKKLLQRGANTSTRDDTGWPLLFQGARAGSLPVVRWLVEEVGADPRHKINNGKSAEKFADDHGFTDVATYLRDAVKGPRDTEEKDPGARTSSAAASKSDSKKISSVSLKKTSLACGGVPELRVRHSGAPVHPGAYNVYDTTTEPPGRVLLLSYRTFPEATGATMREGAEHDVANLVSVFEQMGYEIVVREDLTWKDTVWEIQDFSKSKRLKEVGCAIVVVSSHGGNEVSSFLTYDGKDVSVKYLHEVFIKNQSKEVKQMPKIFFFQFCRGNVEPIAHVQTDSVSDHPPENIMSFFSTTDGFVAFRHPLSGSIFLTVVCEVLAERACEDNLDDLFREVQQRYKREGLGATPEKQDLGFRKKFYFNPRPQN
ncbi:Caspase-7 [Chionoecetes opilio]|uniref:Caspase-7 n=1 Tax=Chionoecetes opilio TaxID=41210 RepID=A0A8J4YS70_CHIOP|nr:Caspase-7 [Chionoecetes opilio]